MIIFKITWQFIKSSYPRRVRRWLMYLTGFAVVLTSVYTHVELSKIDARIAGREAVIEQEYQSKLKELDAERVEAERVFQECRLQHPLPERSFNDPCSKLGVMSNFLDTYPLSLLRDVDRELRALQAHKQNLGSYFYVFAAAGLCILLALAIPFIRLVWLAGRKLLRVVGNVRTETTNMSSFQRYLLVLLALIFLVFITVVIYVIQNL